MSLNEADPLCGEDDDAQGPSHTLGGQEDEPVDKNGAPGDSSCADPLVNGKDEDEDAVGELSLEPATDEEYISEDDFESDLDDEDEDEDEEEASTNAPLVAGSRIQRALRFTIQKLKDAAIAMDPQDPNPPVLPKFMRDLQQISVDSFVGLFLPGFSRQVIELFEKDEWSISDFESLPLASIEGKSGIYGLFAADLYDEEDAAYVGCSVNILKRMKQHKRECKKTEPSKSHLYSHLQKQGGAYNDRVLARFAPPLAKRMHLELVEGIFTIWLGTLNKPNKDSWKVTVAGYNLAKRIREEVDLGEAPNWKLLNSAFQLTYRVPPPRPKQNRTCANPHCRAKEAEVPGHFRCGKPDWDSRIAGAMICLKCFHYGRYHSGALWTPLKSRTRTPISMKEPCAICAKVQVHTKGRPDWDYYAGKWLCNSCYDQLRTRLPKTPRCAICAKVKSIARADLIGMVMRASGCAKVAIRNRRDGTTKHPTR
jgi:hypothetical protein